MKIVNLLFFFNGKEEECVLAVANTSDFSLENLKEWLSDGELEKLDRIGIEKRRKEFCLGRATTKKALSSFVDGLVFRNVNIINEKSGCPVIGNSDYATSISHAGDVVASLVFKGNFSFGLDIENLKRNSIKAVKSVISDGESIPDDAKSLMAAWTLKEALGKALKCGLSLPFEEFELSQFTQDTDRFSCSYAKHPEFKGGAAVYDDYSYAIAYPAGISGFQIKLMYNMMIKNMQK
ncbi:MAG: 4'-phosphopantetheinyl transferase superfamily protein [Holosporaceae bacterium]|jgi:4'-phosphopantetheinyl transferase|nr:4'-phosphopantetheinyl transferase superfamily protein [Holosporaceae bacterium]